MEAKKVNLMEWGYFGEGGTAVSFCNKQNGNLFLKLNKAGYPEQLTWEEFNASKLFGEMGLPTPAVYDYVTDGERFGYVGERIKGKVSFARILSNEPSRREEIARRFALMARDLHGTKADTTRMKSCLDNFRSYLGDLSFVPSDVADKVRKCLDRFNDVPFCLHGDFNPGNVISNEGREYWIGVNSFMYGDPYWDLATLYIIANCIPSRVVKERYHLSPSELRAFCQSFGRHYLGDSWDSGEVRSRIQDAVVVRCCALIRRNPRNAYLYVPFIRGKKFLFRLRLVIMNGARNSGTPFDIAGCKA